MPRHDLIYRGVLDARVCEYIGELREEIEYLRKMRTDLQEYGTKQVFEIRRLRRRVEHLEDLVSKYESDD